MSLFRHRPAPARALASTLLVAALLAAGGCSSPNPRFYTLVAPAGEPPVATANLSVAVGPVRIPAVVDRPQLVLDAGANEVHIDEFSRWAAPLADGIGGVLVATLARQLGTVEVWPWGQVTRPTPGVQVGVDVQRFEIAPGEAVRLDVLWTVQRKGAATPQIGRSTVREPVGTMDIDAAVAAQGRALQRVGEDIAKAIRAP